MRAPGRHAVRFVFTGPDAMNTVTCPGCKATAEHDCGGSVGGIAATTGYNPVMLHTCEFLYVCPACMVKVDKAIAILREVFPDGNDLRNVYMLHLMRQP